MLEYCIRAAGPDDVDSARAVMLDTVYRDFATGYVPRRHADIIGPAAAHLAPARHTLLVALDPADGQVVATAALDSRGPVHPPNPRDLAERYPSGETAQLRRVYVRPAHRRRGLARHLVAELLAFAAADDGYRACGSRPEPDVSRAMTGAGSGSARGHRAVAARELSRNGRRRVAAPPELDRSPYPGKSTHAHRSRPVRTERPTRHPRTKP
ncbi:GNAT family N-acetyltransferase [Streptomyces galilaeus]